MKVLHVYKGYYPDLLGGVCEFIRQLTYGTQKLGVENSLLVLTHTKSNFKTEIVDGLTIHWCPSTFEAASTPFSYKAIKRFKQLAEEVDIIHYHYPYPFADILDSFSGINKRKIVTYHTDIIKQKYLSTLYAPIRDMFFNKVDKIVATSPNYFKTSDVLQNYKSKVEIITIGLFRELYSKTNKEKLVDWASQVEPKFFLFVGAMRYYKALPILIKAAKINNLPVLIVGGGREQKKYIELANKLNASNVKFLGVLTEEDKIALLKLCYAVVLPSHLRSEALGISLIEGAMLGKPLISCEIGTGTSFVNIDHQTGLVCPPKDPEALSKAMQELWDNPEVTKQMANGASERFKSVFSGEKMAQSYTKLYKEMLWESGTKTGT
ncbi:D-rhamnosyltransferase WbpZ [Hyphomicrobiales bacterium 4NK60-0047b]|jgi:rhamnosyl/mannosyltransferase